MVCFVIFLTFLGRTSAICGTTFTEFHAGNGFIAAKSECDTTSVLSFHGIQYGKPTRGNEIEELLTPITGTYTLPGPGCPTHTPPAGSDIWGEPVVLDERCNSLNVVSPVTDVSTVLPVFVWIHGGASFTGNAADNHMDTRKLAVDSKVYVIEAQYRLGLLGFMRRDRDTTKHSLGETDVVNVLRWIHAHLHNIIPGADLNNVLIAGHSYGAQLVANMLLNKDASGLFHRAWMDSVPLGIPNAGQNRIKWIWDQTGDAVAFETLDIDEVMTLQAGIFKQMVATIFTQGSLGVMEPFAAYTPTNDGQSKNVLDRIVSSGILDDVPVLVTFTSDEGSYAVPLIWDYISPAPAIEVPLLMDYFFGVDGFSDMQHEYPKPGLFASKLEWKKFVGDIFTASLFSVPSMMVAASINDHGGKAFAAVDTQSLSVGCYGLSKECSDNGWVCHTDDLYCIFDTFSTMEHCDQVGDAGVYGERIRQTIAAFVHDHPVKYDGVALQMPTSSNMRLLTMHGSNPSEIEFYNSRVSAFKRGVEAQLGTFASRATIGREAAERCF